MKITDNHVLADIGEFRLIDEIIMPIARKYEPTMLLGDDCAFVKIGSSLLALTTDAGPRSLINEITGYEDDFEADGWLAVVATASDVASAGARPLFLTNCIDAPPQTSTVALSKFMSGYFRACAEFGFQNAGGDVRQGPTLMARVCGAGVVEHGNQIGRRGARQGDQLVVLGPTGRYMATYLLAKSAHPSVIRENILTPEAAEILRFPRPRLQEMALLAEEGFIRAASDCSDGLLGAIDNIARGSQCGFEMHLDDQMLSSEILTAANTAEINPWNIFFCWGDWSMAAVVQKDRWDDFREKCLQHKITWKLLGHASEPLRRMKAYLSGREFNVTSVRNENFVSKGYSAGVSGHIEYMLRTPIFTPAE